MLLLRGILVVSTLLLGACAAKHVVSKPFPVVGVDIIEVYKGQEVPFNGTLFSPYYLNEYLQWKNN